METGHLSRLIMWSILRRKLVYITIFTDRKLVIGMYPLFQMAPATATRCMCKMVYYFISHSIGNMLMLSDIKTQHRNYYEIRLTVVIDALFEWANLVLRTTSIA